jgi:hypothetical protein
MSSQISLQWSVAGSKQAKSQLAQYLEQQPASRQAFHKWMKRLEVVSAGIIAAAFILAMYVSVAWKSVNPIMIPTAWFLFAASVTPATVLVGLHAVVLRAFPPIILPGTKQKFVTGREAVGSGWGLVLVGLGIGAFWGLFAYSVWTLNLAMLEPLIRILGVVVGVGIAVSVLYSIYHSISRSI